MGPPRNSASIARAARVATLLAGLLALLPLPGAAQGPLSVSVGVGGGGWSGEDYEDTGGGVMLEAVARLGVGPVQIGVGTMRSQYTTEVVEATFDHDSYFAEIRREVGLAERLIASIAGRLGYSEESGGVFTETFNLFGLPLGTTTEIRTTGVLYGIVVGLGTQASESLLLELRGIAGWHSSDNVVVDGVKIVGATNNGRLLGLQLTLGYTF